mmetsp:Transcript_45577/g.108412  ORF Transcript_45577/g.108412 Transcript_45577/m.108412 type:complete len:400 (+) Transcript_45577:99-1298(+)
MATRILLGCCCLLSVFGCLAATTHSRPNAAVSLIWEEDDDGLCAGVCPRSSQKHGAIALLQLEATLWKATHAVNVSNLNLNQHPVPGGPTLGSFADRLTTMISSVSATLTDRLNANSGAFPQGVARIVLIVVVVHLITGMCGTSVVVWLIYRFELALGQAVMKSALVLEEHWLGVGVSVGSTSISLFRGRISMTDVKVNNPAGWSTEHLLTAENFTLDLSFSSLLRAWWYDLKLFEVETFELEGMRVAYERTLLSGKSNIGDLLEHIKSRMPTPKNPADSGWLRRKGHTEASAASPQPEPSKQEEAEDQEIILHRIRIKNIGAAMPLIGQVMLPPIECEDFDTYYEQQARKVGPICVRFAEMLLTSLMAQHCKSGGEKTGETPRAGGWQTSLRAHLPLT